MEWQMGCCSILERSLREEEVGPTFYAIECFPLRIHCLCVYNPELTPWVGSVHVQITRLEENR
jgi:hypothetical protein